MVTCSRTLACHPGPWIPCGQSPVHERRHDDVWRRHHPLRRLHQWPHQHNRAACPIACPAHSRYAARLAAGKGQLRSPLQTSPWSRLFWATRRRETMTIPHPTGHFCDCPVLRAYSTHRDVPHPWARHPDLQVPPDGVTTCPSPSPLQEPSPFKCFAPVTVSAGTCTYVPSIPHCTSRHRRSVLLQRRSLPV